MAYLHHMGITVSNTAATVDFYRSFANVQVTGPLIKKGPAVDAVTGQVGAEIHITFINFYGDEPVGEPFVAGNTVIELAEYRGTDWPPLDPANNLVGAAHPAIVVTDIELAIAQVTAAGYEATSAPQVATSGPMQGMQYAYIIGPDNVRVELLQMPS